MGTRHELAMSIVQTGEQDLSKLVSVMRFALDECQHMNKPIHKDAAVILLAWQMAMVTGTDHPEKMNYREHLDACVEEIMNDNAAFCSPAGFN